MRPFQPRLVIHGQPGGIAIMTAAEAAASNIDISGCQGPDIPPDVVKRAPRLRWIQFTIAGVDHLCASSRPGSLTGAVSHAGA